MNGTIRFLWVFLLSLMAHLAAHAQKYQIRPIGLEQGLSCNYVVSMAQDKHGFLWIATEEGLNRFDGNRFFNYYKRRDRQGISSSELNCVIDDAKAPVVWIGTKNDGLNSFSYQTEEWQCYKHDAKDAASIATNDITKITNRRMANSGFLPIGRVWNSWIPPRASLLISVRSRSRVCPITNCGACSILATASSWQAT